MGMNVSKDERRKKISQIVVSEGSIRVRDLAKYFDVTMETIRQDIIHLEEEGIVDKIHGGASLASSFLERPIALKEAENKDKKIQIAHKAIELIPENGFIMLDGGTTTYNIAKLIALKEGLSIFTNSLIIANLLSGTNNTVFSLGGEIRKSSRASIGIWALNMIKTLNVDLAFVGTDSLTSKGADSISYDEVLIKEAMIEQANIAVVVSDSSKTHKKGLFQCSTWEDINYLITDNEIDLSKIKHITDNTQVLIGEGVKKI